MESILSEAFLPFQLSLINKKDLIILKELESLSFLELVVENLLIIGSKLMIMLLSHVPGKS